MSDDWHILDDGAILPDYKEMYGKSCSHDELVSIVRRYSVNDWLCNLSRLACLLAGSRYRDPSWSGPFVKWFVPQRISKRLRDWTQQHVSAGRNVVYFTERYAGILAELAIVHAPEEAEQVMDFPGDGSVFDALLMLASLEAPDVSVLSEGDLYEAASSFAALWFRSISRNSTWLATKGFHVFKALQDRSPGSKAQKWAHMFKQATGVDIDAFYAGGFQCLLVTWGQSVDELAAGWRGLPSGPENAQLQNQWESFQAYYSLRRGDLCALKQLILKEKDVARLDDVSLIPLLTYPVVQLTQDRTYPLFLRGIGESLYEGIYHAVSDAAKDAEGKLAESRQEVGGVFGQLFQAHVLDVLVKSFGDRVLSTPKRTDNGDEATDAIILCPKGIIVLEIKSGRIPLRHHYLPKEPDGLIEELKKAGLHLACSQLGKSVRACREGLIAELSYCSDLNALPIQPVIVTHELVPLFVLSRPLLDPILEDAQPDQHTRRPILMSTRDVEALAALPPGDDIWAVLTGYVSDSNWLNKTFNNFLVDTRRAGGQVAVNMGGDAASALTQYLGMSDGQELAE